MLTSADLENLAFAAHVHAQECSGAERAYFESLATKARDEARTKGYTPSTDTSTTEPF